MMAFAPTLHMNIVESIEEIAEFVFTREFQNLLRELYSLPVDQRPLFVESVLLSGEQLTKRGVKVPDTLLIQRSVFADNRPTLFCVSKELHGTPPWHKTTITFDNDSSTASPICCVAESST